MDSVRFVASPQMGQTQFSPDILWHTVVAAALLGFVDEKYLVILYMYLVIQ
jgi:hypothetical protein